MAACSARTLKREIEAEKQQKDAIAAREQKNDDFNADMKALSQGALNEAKKSNEIAKQSLEIAQSSKYLSNWSIGISIVAIIVSVILHFF